MAERSDLDDDLQSKVANYDLLLPQMLVWESKLPRVYSEIAQRSISPASGRARILLTQNGPFAEELAWALYNSDASPRVGFIDMPYHSAGGRAYDAALGAIHRFLNGVVPNSRQQPFEAALQQCKHFCEKFNKAQMKRLNHMIKTFPGVVSRARSAHPEAHIRVLMLVLMENADIISAFEMAAKNEPTFTFTQSRQAAMESSLLLQFREFVETGTISDLLAARVIGLYFVFHRLMTSDSNLSAGIRFAAEAEVATMDLAALRQMYEQ